MDPTGLLSVDGTFSDCLLSASVGSGDGKDGFSS